MEWNRLTNPAFIVTVLLLFIGAASLNAMIRGLKIHLQKEAIYPADGRTLTAVPRELRSWEMIGQDEVLSQAMAEELGTDNYISRRYAEKDPADPRRPRTVDLHAAYYTGMIDTVPHVPERCMVGGGAQIDASLGVVPLPMDSGRWRQDPFVVEGDVLRVRMDDEYGSAPGSYVRLPFDVERAGLRTTEFIVPETDFRLFAGYFFVANGHIALSAEEVRLRAFDLQTRYAYYLKVQFSSPNVESGEELAEIAGELLDELLPELLRCVPDWVVVRESEASEASAS